MKPGFLAAIVAAVCGPMAPSQGRLLKGGISTDPCITGGRTSWGTPRLRRRGAMGAPQVSCRGAAAHRRAARKRRNIRARAPKRKY